VTDEDRDGVRTGAGSADAAVLTQDERDRLTPGEVVELLAAGNRQFTSGELTARDHLEQARETASGQYPMAVVLACMDSRVPVESLFDRGIGDIFVIRVAGNLVNEDVLGSMEFACRAAGAKLILVLGHEQCGAVKGAIDDVRLGHLEPMLEKLKPAVSAAAADGEGTSADADFVHRVAVENVKLSAARIRKESEILAEMESAGQIGIAEAIYDLASGRVTFLDR
jgi:carbonic anhydrase